MTEKVGEAKNEDSNLLLGYIFSSVRIVSA